MENKRRYPSLSGLKGIFMFCIIAYHILPYIHTPLIAAIPLTSFLANFGGDLGDCMFFVLSGFLMATGYRERVSNHQISFGEYLMKRLKKLYPLYLLSNLVMLLLFILEERDLSVINLQRTAFTLLLQGFGGLPAHPYNGPSWFVGPLFLCYILYYALAYHAKNATQYRCAAVLIILWGYAVFQSGSSLPFCREDVGLALMAFFIGCALSEVYPWLSQKQYKWFPGVCFLTLSFCGFLLMRYGVDTISGNVMTGFAFVICPLILLWALEGRLFSAFLQTRPVQFLGKISVSVYFWHLPILVAFTDICRMAGIPFLEPQLLLYLVCMLVFCTLSYRFIENRKQVASPGNAVPNGR